MPNSRSIESVEIITLLLKYLNFEQLCIVERVNSRFQYFVRSELGRLKIVNLCKIFCGSFAHDHLIVLKISLYVPNIRRLIPQRISEHFCWSALSNLPPLLKLTDLHISYSYLFFNLKTIGDYLERMLNLTKLKLCIDSERSSDREDVDGALLDRINNTVTLKNLISFELSCRDIMWHSLPKCQNLTKLSILNDKLLTRDQRRAVDLLIINNSNLEILMLCGIKINAELLNILMSLTKLKSFAYSTLNRLSDEQDFCNLEQIRCWSHQNTRFEFLNVEELNISAHFVDQADFSQFTRIMLLRCPRLTRLKMHIEDRYLNSTIFQTVNSTLQNMECIHMDKRDENCHQSTTVDKLTKMTGLKHLHTSGFFSLQDAAKISSLKNLQLLHLYENCMSFSEFDDNYLSTMQTLLSGLRLKGLEIHVKSIQIQLATLMDLILDHCPNLEYLSLKNIIITKNQARDSPNRLRLLKFLTVNYSKRYYNKADKIAVNFLTVEDLIDILQKFPFLRVFTSHHFYYSLLKSTIIKKRCRQGKLVVSPKAKNLNQKWMGYCCGPCCSYSGVSKKRDIDT